MPLTDRAILNLKPSDKPEKHFDGGGPHIVVSPAGGKHWRYAYRFQGKQKLLSIGPYPAVSLKVARERRDAAKAKLTEGIDPSEHKKELRKFDADRAENSFAVVAKEWHLKFRDTWTPNHAADIWHRIDKNILAHMGNMPIANIKPFELLSFCGGSKHGARWNRRTGSCRFAVLCSATRWRRDGQSGTSLRICGGRFRRKRPSITPVSPSRKRWGGFSAPLMVTRGWQ